MAKESFYFSHDYNARNDEKILELRSKFGAEGYGIYWMIVETMAENENGGVNATLIGGLSLGYGVAKERLIDIISFCLELNLFYKEGDNYFSKRLLEYKDFRKSMSNFGKIGAEKRWGSNRGANRGANATPNAKESKVKEIKEDNKNSNTLNDLIVRLNSEKKIEKNESEKSGDSGYSWEREYLKRHGGI